MATSELDYSGSPGLNTDIGGVSVAEGIPPSNLNDAIRAMAAFRHDASTRIVGKSAGTYTAVKADHNQFWYCGAVTINLTAATTLGNGWSLFVKAASGTVVIDPAGSELIEGVSSLTLLVGSSAQIICNGVDFYLVIMSVGSNAVTLTGTQTLTNKTLTSPTINNATFTGTGAFTGAVSGTTGTFSSTVTAASHYYTAGSFVTSAATWIAYCNNGANAPIRATASATTITGTLSVTSSIDATTSLSASAGNIVLADGGSGRVLQFQSTYYLDFSTSTGVLRWMMGNVEQAHFGSSGITSTSRIYAEDGGFIATGTSGQFAVTGTGATGTLYLRPRGADVGTFQAALSATTGTMTLTNISETSDATLKSNWTPITKSVVDDVATLEIGSFTWTETGTTGYGVKAQDLQTIMPNVVSVDDDGLLGVNYGKAAMGIVVEACQRIVALEARIAELEAKAA